MNTSTFLSVDELARQSLHLRDRDDPEAAIALLNDGVQQYPDEAILWQCLGLAHRALLDSAPAISAFEKAARLNPNNAKIIHALAHVTMEAGLPALDLFDQVRALTPHDGSVLIGRSAAQLAEGQTNAAISDLEAACRASPLWLEGQRALANLKWLVGEEAGFVSGYRLALADDPQSLPLWLGLFDTCIQVERFDWANEALGSAREALGERDEFAPTAALCASELGDSAQADAIFARLLSQSTYLQNTDLGVRAVRHLLRTGRAAQALILAQQALDRPEANKLWPYVATAWRIMDDPQWQWLEGDDRLVKRVKIYDRDELPALAQCLRRLHQATHEPAGQSVRTGSQTDGPLFARIEPEIRDLRKRIESAVSTHIGNLGPAEPNHPTLRHRPNRVRFAGSWSVRLQDAGHHSNHIHPQGWLSSALYIAVPPIAESGPAPAGHLQLGVPPAELGLNLAPARTIAPEPGWLTLFPSTMWHGTVPIAGGERMTVAFDVKA